MNTQRLDVGSVFERVFALYRDQFSLLIPAALVIFVPVAIINGLVLSAGGILGSLVVAAVSAIATYWYQGMVVEAAQDMLDGRRDHTVGSLINSATPFIAPLLIAGILAGIGIGFGLILLIVPGLYLLTIWAVLAPVIVIERSGAIDAFGRSRQLVKGNGWPVFGVIVILFLLQLVISLVVNGILNDDSFALLAAADLIVKLLIVPLSGLAAAVMFFGLKAAHEGSVPATPDGPVPGVTGGPESPAPGRSPGAPAPESPAPSGAPAPPAQQPLPSGPGVPPQAPPPGELPPQAPPASGGEPQPPQGGGPQAPSS